MVKSGFNTENLLSSSARKPQRFPQKKRNCFRKETATVFWHNSGILHIISYAPIQIILRGCRPCPARALTALSDSSPAALF
ncbi:MAG TPA: hypothetical protein DCX95_03035 [Elusimicrobia bacterium]|nr:hypothetical protein [Elusimicrobiota bacterium]